MGQWVRPLVRTITGGGNARPSHNEQTWLPSYNGVEAGWGNGVQGRLFHLCPPDAHTPKRPSAASHCQDSQACFLLELEEMLGDMLPCLTLEGEGAQGLGG